MVCVFDFRLFAQGPLSLTFIGIATLVSRSRSFSVCNMCAVGQGKGLGKTNKTKAMFFNEPADSLASFGHDLPHLPSQLTQCTTLIMCSVFEGFSFRRGWTRSLHDPQETSCGPAPIPHDCIRSIELDSDEDSEDWRTSGEKGA